MSERASEGLPVQEGRMDVNIITILLHPDSDKDLFHLCLFITSHFQTQADKALECIHLAVICWKLCVIILSKCLPSS